MARVRVLQDLNVISFLHRTDGSNALLPSMTSQPEYLPEDIGPDYTYPGLPYLLDIVFDEQASGIRTNPNQVTSSRINRENWAVHAARKLFKDSKTVPEATLLNAIGRELLSYSIERHDQEIDVEISATRNCLYMLQAALPAQNPSFNLFVSYIYCGLLLRFQAYITSRHRNSFEPAPTISIEYGIGRRWYCCENTTKVLLWSRIAC